MFSVACTRRTFGRSCCGAAVVAFLASKLLSKDLPRTDEELVDLHTDLKCSFAAALHDVESVPKPWCWGLSQVDVSELTQAILQTHGVPAAQAPLRAKLVIQTFGRAEVQKALHGIAPWKSLKALANLQSAPLQLVLPDELNQQSASKSGPKSKRQPSGAKKLLPVKPADIDPAKLVIAPGSFRAGDDDPVGQLPFASVGPLASKTEAASTVGQFRPITVFGLPYRIWSSLQSRHLLQWAECWVDDGVFGNRRGRQASDLWHYLLQQIEHAYATEQPLCGISADLEKCFNCIPRFPALCLAVLAGTPAPVTTAWAGSSANMCRHFKVRDSYCQGFLTSTGLAEGCGLSVFGMLLVDHLFSCWMKLQATAISTLSYVDDWQCLTWDPSLAVRQLALVEEFAQMLDLTVDRKKTFGWSTCATTHGQLRAHGLQVHHQARELGGHFGVSRQHTNRTVKQRIAALDDFWPKLSGSRARYPAKVFMLKAVAWPRGLHAIPSAPLGNSGWTQLRRSATKAIRWKKPGVNAHVLLGLVEVGVDPQFVALLWTCRSVRCHYALDFGSSLLAPLASGCLDLPPASPASIVLARLQHVGLTVDVHGSVADQFGPFCLHGTNPAEVDLRLQWVWSQLVASKVAHRPEFSGLHLVNPAQTRKTLRSMQPDDQALYRLGLAGGPFTESYKAKWQDQDDACHWCGQRDSLAHRYWECPQHQDLRDKLAPQAQALVDLLPSALALRGWALHPRTWTQWISLLLAIPSTVQSPSVRFRPGVVNHVFTDGSCFGQSGPRTRFASWAALLVPDVSDAWTPGSSTVLCAAALAGLCQTAFRAELYAVAYVLYCASCQGTAVCVWTDCLGVVNRYNLTFWGNRKQLEWLQRRPVEVDSTVS
jgi:ribonuclease HI